MFCYPIPDYVSHRWQVKYSTVINVMVPSDSLDDELLDDELPRVMVYSDFPNGELTHADVG